MGLRLRTKIRVRKWLWVAAIYAAPPTTAWGQARALPQSDVPRIYHRLLPEIERIRIFDGHAHPGFADDPDVDAMAAPPAYSAALRVRATNPELIRAAKAMFEYPYEDLSPAHTAWLVRRKEELKKAQGNAYFSGVLDKVQIRRSLANRAMMANYLDPQRFPWVFFGDSFLWPLDNERERARNADQAVYIPLQEKMLHRFMEQQGVTELPTDLSSYLTFVSRTLEKNQQNGGVAIKFEVAYFRPTTFGDPTREQAEAIYRRLIRSGVASESEYRTLQDYIFRYLLQEGARLALPVQIHSSVGIGDYFSLSQSNVMNLENILRDPRYAGATFVLIHAGYPREREATWLAAAKNVYLDTSMLELLMYPSEFKNALKVWLETFPDKLMFGTDAFPYNEAFGVEESYWLGVHSARDALAAALAEMISMGEVTEEQALKMARAYLHDTAAAIYEAHPR